MKISTIKSILLSLSLGLLAFSFPLQVITLNPTIAIAPYLCVALLFAIELSLVKNSKLLQWNTRRPVDLIVTVYVLLVVLHTSWQTAFGFISIADGVSALFVYLFPILYYLYFRSTITDREMLIALCQIFAISVVIATHYIFDSYSMLVLGNVSDFSKEALAYIESRAPGQEHNLARVSPGYRSHGLLEKHSISTAWIVLGCLSILCILPRNRIKIRSFVISLYLFVLIIALNTTAIVGFVLVVLLMEFKILNRYISKRAVRNFMQLIFAVCILLGTIWIFLPSTMFDEMMAAVTLILTGQIDIAVGTRKLENSTYFGGLIKELLNFPHNMLKFPPGVLIGDGFSTFGYQKGGDYGFIELLHIFGLPFFIVILGGLYRLLGRAYILTNYFDEVSLSSKYLWFASSVIIYIIFAEIHYGIWNSKSILPIFFICLAIFDRYPYSPRGSVMKNASRHRSA
jgi:hypothetical protein